MIAGEIQIIKVLVGTNYFASVKDLLKQDAVSKATSELLRNKVMEVGNNEDIWFFNEFCELFEFSFSNSIALSSVFDKFKKQTNKDHVEVLNLYNQLLQKLLASGFVELFRRNMSLEYTPGKNFEPAEIKDLENSDEQLSNRRWHLLSFLKDNPYYQALSEEITKVDVSKLISKYQVELNKVINSLKQIYDNKEQRDDLEKQYFDLEEVMLWLRNVDSAYHLPIKKIVEDDYADKLINNVMAELSMYGFRLADSIVKEWNGFYNLSDMGRDEIRDELINNFIPQEIERLKEEDDYEVSSRELEGIKKIIDYCLKSEK